MELIEIRNADYIAHIDTSKTWLEFKVFPIEEYIKVPSGDHGIGYLTKVTHEVIENFDENKCVKTLDGSYTWRGVWEGRLYFTETEIFGEDLGRISEFYNGVIVPWCENFIKERDPNNSYPLF